MAKSFMATTRPYILFSSARTNLRLLFQSRTQPFVSSVAAISLVTGRNSDGNSVNPVLSCRSFHREPSPAIYGDGCSRVNGFSFSVNRSRGFSTRATNVNDAGSIDQPLMDSMEKKIKEQLNAESVSVEDTSGDGRHVSIDVVSSAFEGESTVNRQRMVYRAIWEELQNTVHAVDRMTTKTPSELESQNQK